MSQTLYIVIGCDTDPDRKDFIDNLPADTLSWRGMLEGIPMMKERIAKNVDSSGKEPILTWCLRVDEQIKSYYGRYASILALHRNFFLELENSGDELAWHPHFWRKDAGSGQWYQECHDVDWQVDMLKQAHADYQSELQGRGKSVRMGWDYHNNDTFTTLQNLGVLVDFSAIPGMRIDSSADKLNTFNSFDWEKTPNHPYYPASSDYSREAKDGEKTSTLIEAPNFVSESLFWGTVRGMVMAKKMKSLGQVFRAIRRPTYWINITGDPPLARPVLRQLEKRLAKKESVLFVSYFHPDELLPNKHKLYSLENMDTNLTALLQLAKKYGIGVKYLKASDIINTPSIIQ